MKKTFVILAIACVAMLMSACKKEGVYNPNQKISKIYTTETTTPLVGEQAIVLTPRHLSESWTWKGNLLEKIDCYNQDGQYSHTVTFTYDSKKRVSKVDKTDAHAEYSYNGKELSEAKYYIGNQLYQTYQFSHDKGKISEIKITTEAIPELTKNVNVNLMQFVLPSQICQAIDNAQKESIAKNGIKGSSTATTTLTWEKNNISKFVYKEENGYEETFEGEYDGYKNPYYGMFGLDFAYSNLSKNNPFKEHYKSSDSDITLMAYTNYEYGDTHLYPIKASRVDLNNLTTVYEYEYK